VVTRSYATNLRKGRIESPGYEKLSAISKAMNFPPEAWFEENVGPAPDGRSDDNRGMAGRVEHPFDATWSSLTHATVVPGTTVLLGGLKAKSLMLTVAVLPCAPAVGAKSRRATSERAAKRSIVFLLGVLFPYLRYLWPLRTA
jgi:hypothetical protein